MLAKSGAANDAKDANTRLCNKKSTCVFWFDRALWIRET